MMHTDGSRALLFLSLFVGCCIFQVVRTSDVSAITVSEANRLDLSHIQEESFPALFFILGSKCGEECEERKFLEHFSSDLLYSGPVYVLNEDTIPWELTLKLPSIILANAERKLLYLGPMRYEDFMDTMHQFSNGVRAARLDDANFEHDTQASTGSTTGTWLIIFDDKMTKGTLLNYDSLALRLRAKGILLGVIDPAISSRTSKRFDIQPSNTHYFIPGVLLLKRSNLYRLPQNVNRDDYTTLLRFAVSEHMQYPSSVIPRPRMRFDEVVDFLVNTAIAVERQYGKVPLFSLVVLITFASGFLFVFVAISYVRFVGGFHSSSAAVAVDDDDDVSGEEDSPTKSPREAGDDGVKRAPNTTTTAGKHKED